MIDFLAKPEAENPELPPGEAVAIVYLLLFVFVF
jgi:hypothetical protein